MDDQGRSEPASTVAAAIRDAASRLAPDSTARLDAELLMAGALGTGRADMLLRHMQAPPPPAFAAMLARRIAREPVAYILGHTEFYGLILAVSPAVLVPRPDSEVAIDAAIRAFAGRTPQRILDCGTGSGALLLAALAQFPAASGIGIDRSEDALIVAQGNADRLGLSARARFECLDWTDSGWRNGLGTFDLILANPPYVEDDAELETAVRSHEPHGALFAGPDGLDAYRVLGPQLPPLLRPDGRAMVEIGWQQGEAVSQMVRKNGLTAEVLPDLAGRQRVVEISRRP